MLSKLLDLVKGLWLMVDRFLPKNKVSKWSIIVGVIIVVLFIVMKMSGGKVPVEVDKVVRGKIFTTVSASGIVESKSVKLGSAQMAGRVDWVGVAEGDKVKAGQILIKLNGYNQARKEYFRIESLQAKGFASDLELERAKTALDNTGVKAPFSGIVTDKAVTPGESVSPGVPLMTVVEMENPWVEVQVDEVDIAKVSVGQRVKFTTDAFQDEEFYGKIIWLNDEAELKKVGGRVRMDEEDLVFRSKVAFEDGAKKLRPGMSVYAEVIVGEKNDVLTVPRTAVTLRDGQKVVFVVDRGRARQKMIGVGDKDVEKVEAISGVSDGETVAVSNLDKLKNNEKVKIVKKKNGNNS